MAYETFIEKRFSLASQAMIEKVRGITDEYATQGFRLTVRQLYYQLVARGEIENTLKSYHRIVNLVNDARMAGQIDWDAIEDRTREFRRRSRWSGGASILDAAARSFHMDMWTEQDVRPFVIIEKEALVGVLEPTCNSYDVPLLAARGYPSASVLYEFVKEDILPNVDQGQEILLIHLGDHDPSGIDMTRDLAERISTFLSRSEYGPPGISRIALNMDQVKEKNPPPNPAKSTDSRFEGYVAQYGQKSWELDALEPAYLARLVQRTIGEVIDQDLWDERKAEIEDIRKRITKVAKEF